MPSARTDHRSPAHRIRTILRTLSREIDPVLRTITLYWVLLTPICLAAAGTTWWLTPSPSWWQLVLACTVIFTMGLAWGVLITVVVLNVWGDSQYVGARQ